MVTHNLIINKTMGNNVVGSTEFKYRLKTGENISFIYYDLKGKNRFPPEPAVELIESRFQACIKEIQVQPEMQTLI